MSRPIWIVARALLNNTLDCETVKELMKKGIVAIAGLIAFIFLLIMTNVTTPRMVGPLGVLAFFILVYIVAASAIYLLLETARRLLEKLLRPGKLLLTVEGVSNLKLYYYSSMIALFPVILLGMQSIGQVRVIEVGLLALFVGLGCFFISKRF